MTKTAMRFGVLVLVAAALTGCETIGDTASSWYSQTKRFFTDSGDGNFIARQTDGVLEEVDTILLAEEAAQTLEAVPAGRTVRWISPESGTRIVLIPGETKFERRAFRTVRDRRLAAASFGEVIGRSYRAKGRINVRKGPGTTHEIVGKLKKGESVTAMARVSGLKWILIGRTGRAFGYVYAPLLRPRTGKAVAAGLRLAEDVRVPAHGDGDKAARLEVAQIKVLTRCRMLNYTIAGGDGRVFAFRACKAGDGAWEVTQPNLAQSGE